MIYLFLGMIAGGINGRVSVLSARGGWFTEDQIRKSAARNLFDTVCMLLGIAAFTVSFFLFSWWWPLLAATLGFMVVPQLVVNQRTYPAFYNLQSFLALIGFGCSLSICLLFADMICFSALKAQNR